MKLPICPAHPERICWGCERLCRASDLACGNGSVRTPHPCEIFGADWLKERDEWDTTPSGVDPTAPEILS